MKRFIQNERGLETVEYAVMTALIVAAVVFAIVLLRGEIVERFNQTAEIIHTAGENPTP